MVVQENGRTAEYVAIVEQDLAGRNGEGSDGSRV